MSNKQKKLFATVLPSFIPEKVFNEYLKMRMILRKPLISEYAIELAINVLCKLRDEGHDPVEVLNQSILNSWTGLYPVKTDSKSDPFAGMGE